MVAPFLPPLKKWINQQKKRDAARQAQVEPVVEEPVAISSDSPAAEVPIANAAFELKRLLSVNVPGQDSPQAASGEGNQANALLAMLRGNASAGGLAPPTNADLPPATPLDQVTHTPPEPGTPHYQHHQPSPAVRQQPPPGFPFPSPAHQRNVSLHPPGFFGQNAHENLQRVMPEMSHMSQQSPHAVRHIHPEGPHPSMQQQLFPGGHPQPIAHGPVAPSASQLPAPRLNNHAMNLLSAFKAPSQSPVGHNAMPFDNSAMGFPGPNQSYMQAQQQQPAGGVQQPRRRSAHQNSLLGLFTSPDPPRAIPVAQPPQPILPLQNAQSPASNAPTPTVPTPQQRNASLAMLTRTLPKAKPTPPPAHTNVDMFPAKQVVQEVQAAQNRAAPEAANNTFAPDAPRAPVSILPRPGSAATRGSPAPPPSESVQTPHKLRRGNKSDSPASFTILQRPSPRADQNGSPEMPQIRQPPPPPKQATPKQTVPKRSVPKQAQEPPKQFQPQILQRPKADQSSPSVEQPSANPGEQRNALLALFAKQSLGPQGESRSGSAMSNNSGAPLPTDPSIFRSRLTSTSSVLSNGGDADGLRSPSTPVEAKGFLLDYLNGVVKSEKNKGGPKRGPV